MPRKGRQSNNNFAYGHWQVEAPSSRKRQSPLDPPPLPPPPSPPCQATLVPPGPSWFGATSAGNHWQQGNKWPPPTLSEIQLLRPFHFAFHFIANFFFRSSSEFLQIIMTAPSSELRAERDAEYYIVASQLVSSAGGLVNGGGE